jgi:hypothetical protein
MGHLLGRIVDIGAEVLLGLLRADGSSLLAVDPGWRPNLPCTAAGSGFADLLVFADPSGPATADFPGGSRQPRPYGTDWLVRAMAPRKSTRLSVVATEDARIASLLSTCTVLRGERSYL